MGSLPKKTFAQLSIDRCFKSIDKNKETGTYLMFCLRYRTQLSLSEGSDDTKSEERGRTSRTKRLNSAALHPGMSMFDTLLNLLQDYDAAGRVEIFRLVLERRCPVPLFLSNFECHLKQQS